SLVRLQNSVLFDEVDFRGTTQVTSTMCAAGCKVYATISITTENMNIAQKILIYDPLLNKNTSVGHLSSLFLEGTQEKAYIEMGNADVVTVYNTNAKQESAPLALWIVSTKSPYFRTAEVFEPLKLTRPKATAPDPITILSAQPFTLTVQPGDQSNAVLARTVGYDAIDRNNADACYNAMDYDFGVDFFGLTLSINGPLLTLAFDSKKYPNSKVEMSADTAINRFPSLYQPVFLSSPGFVCGSSTSDQVRETRECAESRELLNRTTIIPEKWCSTSTSTLNRTKNTQWRSLIRRRRATSSEIALVVTNRHPTLLNSHFSGS
ncbi:hypothetical protein PENTCL1PPCAC_9832, partial [Pristionchus entomophagus]